MGPYSQEDGLGLALGFVKLVFVILRFKHLRYTWEKALQFVIGKGNTSTLGHHSLLIKNRFSLASTTSQSSLIPIVAVRSRHFRRSILARLISGTET